jgi:hypothetical protein
MYHDTLKETAKPNLIKFIMLTRFSNKIQNKLGTSTTPTTFIQFKELLQKTFKSPNNALTIQADLVKSRQNGQSLMKYIEHIESLIAELNSIHISELGDDSKSIVTQMNDKIALNTFKQGLNDNLKTTIYAAQPKTFSEAKALAIEVATPQEQSSVFHYNSNYNSNKRRYPNNRYNNRNQNNFRNNNYQGNRKQVNHNNHNNQGRNGRYDDKNRNQSYQSFNKNNSSRNVYVTNSENGLAVSENGMASRDLPVDQ